MKNKRLLLITIATTLSLSITFFSCAPSSTLILTEQQPVDVVLVSGPLAPVNPDGLTVEITLKNISIEPVTSLIATIKLGRTYTFEFYINPSSPLLLNESAVSRVILTGDRKSTRLNSSHGYISYAVF